MMHVEIEQANRNQTEAYSDGYDEAENDKLAWSRKYIRPKKAHMRERDVEKSKLIGLFELEDFTPVYELADKVRKDNVGDIVHIRAIIEFSNYCKRQCKYCGINCTNKQVQRYRMTPSEILSSAKDAAEAGYRTIVLQSGEDAFFTKDNGKLIGEIVSEIKKLGVYITVSCGELDDATLKHIKDCGADKYLLKHETADPKLYDFLHPCGTLAQRTEVLKTIKKLGYLTGSGFMVGLPGQTTETLAQDILLLKELQCDMAGIGPFISHPATPLRGEPNGSTEMTRRAIALTRIMLPKAHLPVATSLGVLDDEEKKRAFSGGANVIMKKVTPDQYKVNYEIYPATFQKTEIVKDRKELEQQIRALGREPL